MRLARAALGSLLAVGTMCLVALAVSTAHADPIGLYVGAGVGEADVKLDQVAFSENHSGYKILVGLRPIPVVGGELEYVDFGHPSTTLATGASADAEVRGSALFGVLYLPLPVPTLDLYAKVGLARLQTTASAQRNNFELFRFDQTNTRVAFGAGAQVKMSAFALRGEYEQFSSESGDPSFWSLALTWSF
jgi:opacity protein-like surface antigen